MALEQWQNPASNQSRMPLLKKLFWAYFLLLIFEGALRKWILPQFSAPLLVIRDPLGMLIIFEAYRTNKWPERWTVVTGILTVGLLFLCVMQALIVDNPWVAALYGLCSDLLPFPVAFIMGENLDAEDLRRFGVCTLWLMLPETALEVAQYLAPARSFLNAGAYTGAAQIGYVGAHVRASGTFSFVIGPSYYVPMAAAFILYGLVSEKFARKWLLWAATFALILSVPVIGSRTLVFELGAVVACAAVAAMCGVSQLVKSIKIIVPLFAVLVLVSFLPVFSAASNMLRERWQGANAIEGGTAGRAVAFRTVVPITTRIEETDFASNPVGIGMGQGSAAVSVLLHGKVERIVAEDEFGRMIVELGPIAGIAFMLFRFSLAVIIASTAFARAREQKPLALLLAPLLFSTVFLATLEQPTEQGFMVIILAFSLAALKRAEAPVLRVPLPNFGRLPARPSVRRYSE